MLTDKLVVIDALALLGLVVVETIDPPELAAIDVKTGVVSAVSCVTTTSESSISFLGDSLSSVIMGVCSDLINFPD